MFPLGASPGSPTGILLSFPDSAGMSGKGLVVRYHTDLTKAAFISRYFDTALFLSE